MELLYHSSEVSRGLLDFIYKKNFIQADLMWTPATKDNRRISHDRQRKCEERAIKLLLKHVAEVDIIKKYTLQN